MTKAIRYALRVAKASKKRPVLTDADKVQQKVNDARAVFRAE